MAKDIKNEEPIEAATISVGGGGLETAIRQRAQMMIAAIAEEELEQTLGAAPSVRVGEARAGYRHGTGERTLTTSLGPTTFAMPRARLVTAEGTTEEWRSDLVPRYQRRSAEVDEAMCHTDRGGNQLVIEDQNGRQSMTLRTPSGKTSIAIGLH